MDRLAWLVMAPLFLVSTLLWLLQVGCVVSLPASQSLPGIIIHEEPAANQSLAATSCYPGLGFAKPAKNALPKDNSGWWCNPSDEYAFLGFSYEVTACKSVPVSPAVDCIYSGRVFRSEPHAAETRVQRYPSTFQWSLCEAVWRLRPGGLLVRVQHHGDIDTAVNGFL